MYVPSVAVGGVVICSVDELPVVGFGAKVAAAPAGRPPTMPNVTAAGRFVRLSCTVKTAVEPGASVTEAGVAVIASELDTGALTVSPPDTLPLTLPLVPYTVKVTAPVGVVDVVLTVSAVCAVLPELSVTDAGLNADDE